MSAFLCSDRHTAVVALLSLAHGTTYGDPLKACSALRNLNNAAMAHRYGDKPTPMGKRARALADAAGWLKAHPHPADRAAVVVCFAYQCDEGDVLEAHKAAQDLKDVQAALLKASSHPPGALPGAVTVRYFLTA